MRKQIVNVIVAGAVLVGGMALGISEVNAVSVRAVTATASSAGVVDVSWTRPSDATSNDDYAYQVSYRSGTSGLYTVVAVAKGITTTSLSGLTGGTTYTIVVEAIPTKGPQFASVGCSAYAATSSDACTAFTSAASTTVIAQEAPDAPTIASAEASSGQISLVFGAPNLRGSSLTGYEATCGSAVATGSVSPITVTGLTNGISYTCTVRANSNQGFSAASSASEALVPSTTPDTMEKPSGTASDASATISWTAVAATDSVGVGTSIDDGGSAITGYEVAVYDSANTLTTSVNAAAGATSAVASGLTNGTNYTAKVRAKNTNGSGTYSEASTAFTPVSAGAGSVTVFTEPAGAVNGANFTTQPVAKIGTTSGRIVTASIASGAGTLSGTLSATTGTDGKATFTNLRITGTAGAFRLQFAAIGYQSALSGSFTLIAGAASRLAVSRQPVGGNSGSALSTQPIVRVADTGGNFTNTINKQVTASLFSGAGTLSGTVVATTNASGIATFTNLVITGSTGQYVLRFTDTTGGSALTAVSSSSVSITGASSGDGDGGGGSDDEEKETTTTTIVKPVAPPTTPTLPKSSPKTALPASAGIPVKLGTLPSQKLIESVGMATNPGVVTLLLDAPTLPPKTRVAQFKVALRPIGKGRTITRTLSVSASGAPIQPSFSNISGKYRIEVTVISMKRKVLGTWKSPIFMVTKKKK
jgi:Fibronectin type III domain